MIRGIKKLIKQLIDNILPNIRTHLIGKVVSYDPETNTCEIQPVLNKMQTTNAENQTTKIPSILKDVPVKLIGSGKVFCGFAPAPGTYGILTICDRDLENWLLIGGDGVDPSSTHMFDLSDAIFEPSIVPLVEEDDETTGKLVETIEIDRINLRTRSNITAIAVKDDETIEIKTEKTLTTIDTDGIIVIKNEKNQTTIGSDGAVTINIEDGAALNLTGKDGDCSLTIGDGAVGVALGPALQAYIDQTQNVWTKAHTHPTAFGPSGPPTEAATLQPFDTAIISTKITVPDG